MNFHKIYVGYFALYPNKRLTNLNDDPDTLWHSKDDEKERGFEVEFDSEVNFHGFRIGTRKDCCTDRYKNLVLKADGKVIARTTENFMPYQENLEIVFLKPFFIQNNSNSLLPLVSFSRL